MKNMLKMSASYIVERRKVKKAGRRCPDASMVISEAITVMAANSKATIASKLAREWAVCLNRAFVPTRDTNWD
jgi:hypothetical protein